MVPSTRHGVLIFLPDATPRSHSASCIPRQRYWLRITPTKELLQHCVSRYLGLNQGDGQQPSDFCRLQVMSLGIAGEQGGPWS